MNIRIVVHDFQSFFQKKQLIMYEYRLKKRGKKGSVYLPASILF